MIHHQYLFARRAPRRTLLALAVLFLLALVVWIIGMVFVYFHTGAEWEISAPYAKNTLSLDAPSADWRSLEPAIGEAPDAYLSQELADAYLEAWQSLNYAYRQKNTEVWKDHFAESLWAELDSLLSGQKDFQVRQADLGHHLYLHTFSLDKQLAAFTDKGVKIKKKILTNGGQTTLFNTIQEADYDVVMTLDDGKWRIRHFRRLPYTPQPEALVPVADSLKVSIKDHNFWLGDTIFHPAGINYYPMETPWFDFWLEYDTLVIANDLAIIRGLGLNTIRTFVFYDLFGGSTPKTEMLQKLDNFLDLAERNDLKVVLTLFDFLPDYEIRSYPPHEKHLSALLSRYRTHPALLAWDLKNEPDLDFEIHGQTAVLDWLRYMVGRARIYDPDHPVTIGWSDAAPATLLTEELDFLSFHFYKSVDSLASCLLPIRDQIPGKPVVISEFGLPTYNSLLVPGGHSEAEQAVFYQQFLDTLSTYSQTAFISWTLYDFPELPDNVFGGPFWRKIPQKHYGIIRTDGGHKPAAAVLFNWQSR